MAAINIPRTQRYCFGKGHGVTSGSQVCHLSVIGAEFIREELSRSAANILQAAEGKSILGINTGRRTVNRAPSEDKLERIQLQLVVQDRHADGCKTGRL
jgi:hypothetical protein